VALITGGDSGMGRAAAIAFAREDADVAINYLPDEQSDADDVIALIRTAGRKGVAIPGDLRQEAFCEELVARAIKELAGLDILVSNAGRQQAHNSILDISTEQFDWTMKTNIYAPFWIIKAALPSLPPGSCIIATASEQAYDPSAELYDYAQTKAATMKLREIAGEATGTEGGGGAFPEKQKQFGSQTPMGRAGMPAELAGIYVQLADNQSSFATGQVYGAAGGSGQP
jgi:NAD(P)-dependent dehydrogenase (short-subunit alcohol dehydrogenase family)